MRPLTGQVQLLGLADVLEEHARSRPAFVASVGGSRRRTYGELADDVQALATVLWATGFRGGGRLLWLGQNSDRFLDCLLAVAGLGGVICPANWRQSSNELRALVDDLEPSIVVWDGDTGVTVVPELRRVAGPGVCWLELDGTFEQALVEGRGLAPVALGADPTVPFLAVYSAAYDGVPKAVVLPQVALLVQSLVYGRALEVSDASSFLASGPLFHLATLMMVLTTFHHGGSNVFCRRADAQEMCAMIDAERCTHAFVVPPTLEAMRAANADGSYDLTSLWAAPDLSDWTNPWCTPPEAPWALRPGGYGQTEVSGMATFTGLGRPSAGNAGRPSPMASVRLVDPDGADVAGGEVGEILVRGPIVTTGYLRSDGLDRARVRDGWHRANDLGRREPDGSISFIGPKGALIKSAAENVYPVEVESCLLEHPRVVEVCVIGRPDEAWGQRVTAVVVASPEGPPVSERELVEHCQARIASYKKPKDMVFVDALPRTPDGRVDRAEVDARFGGGGYPGLA